MQQMVTALLQRAASAENPWDNFRQSMDVLYGSTTIAEVKVAKQRVGRMWEEWCHDYLTQQGYNVTFWSDSTPEQRESWQIPVKTDHGIDLVAEQAGKRIAVQCKWRGKENALSWSSITTFLALTEQKSTVIWHERWIMTNARGVKWKLLKPKNVKVLALGTWKGLSREIWCAMAGTTSYKLDEATEAPATLEELRAARLARFA